MPDCHKCRWNMKGSRHCLKCKGPSTEPVHHNKRHCSLENIPESELARLYMEKKDKESELANFFRLWLSFPQRKRNFIADLIAQPTAHNSKLARKYRVSRQAISIKIRRLIKEIPELEPVLKSRLKRKPC